MKKWVEEFGKKGENMEIRKIMRGIGSEIRQIKRNCPIMQCQGWEYKQKGPKASLYQRVQLCWYKSWTHRGQYQSFFLLFIWTYISMFDIITATPTLRILSNIPKNFSFFECNVKMKIFFFNYFVHSTLWPSIGEWALEKPN